MLKRSIAFLTSLMFVFPSFGYSWGNKGHQTVGRIAQLFLQDDNAQTTLDKIQAILKPGESLASIATWADTVKRVHFGPDVVVSDKDTQAFRRDLRNKNNRVWHFDDLPLDCLSYDACDVNPIKFTTPTDIVHMINTSIGALRATSSPARFSKRNALRLIAHLVGDLHQPLHVGSGYIDAEGTEDSIVIARPPQDIKAHDFPSDHGANHLLINGIADQDLHFHWDSDLVDLAGNGAGVNMFASTLKSSIAVDTNWNTQGQFLTWAKQWASDTVKQSADHAYSMVSITAALGDDPEADTTKFAIELGNGYDSANRDVVETQLVKAGYRLAKLLEAILN